MVAGTEEFEVFEQVLVMREGDAWVTGQTCKLEGARDGQLKVFASECWRSYGSWKKEFSSAVF